MMDRLPVTYSKGVRRKPFAKRREIAYADEGVQSLAIYLWFGSTVIGRAESKLKRGTNGALDGVGRHPAED